MYQDPAGIRKHTVKLRLSDEEKKILIEVAAGGQQAVVARQLVIENILDRFDPEGMKALTAIGQNERIKKVTKLIEKMIAEEKAGTTQAERD